MTTHRTEFLVLGSGTYSRALAHILEMRHIPRLRDERGWQWPRVRAAANGTFLLVIPPHFFSSQIIRWHREAWQCPSFRQARCGIICFDHQQREDLRERDVFGRAGRHGDAFADWDHYIAICEAHGGLSSILDHMRGLNPLPTATWARREREASIVLTMITAIHSRDPARLRAIVDKANAQDWDVICPSAPEFGGHHEYANRIRKWLASVTRGVTPCWKEGMALFSTLLRDSCNNT